MSTLARRSKTAPRARTGRASTRERLDTHERREQLLAVAKTLFLEAPYDQVSMDDLAARAGVSKGLNAPLTPEDLPPLERLHLGMRAYLRYVEENAEAWVGLFTSGLGIDPSISDVVDRTRSTLAERILKNMPIAVTPTHVVMARGYIGFVEAATLAWLPERRETHDELVERFIRVLGSALLPQA